MGYKSRKAEFTIEQATQLLSRGDGIVVNDMQQIGFTNDVFRVETAWHGNYYVKFYTARWYRDRADQSGNVEQELAAYHILVRRGISLPYDMWGDCSCSTVDEAVLITSELPGIALPAVCEEHPEDEQAIWETLGRYLRRMHDIRFTNHGALGPETSRCVPRTGVVPLVIDPSRKEPSPRVQAEERQKDVLAILEKAAEDGNLPSSAARALRSVFGRMADVVEPELANPVFTQLNVHDHHFHLLPASNGWQIAGFYDFEHASASDPHADLVCLETTVTPRTRSYAWRAPFFRGYGELRSFDSLKLNLLLDVLGYAGDSRRMWVPDQDWLNGQWERLADAQSIEDLVWFPVGETVPPNAHTDGERGA